MKYYIYITLLFFLSFFSLSCSKTKPISLELKNPDCMNPDIQWALINEPFVAYRSEGDFDSNITAHGRLGDVERIIGVLRTKDLVWYRFSKGWLDASSILVYDTELKAQTGSKYLLEKK